MRGARTAWLEGRAVEASRLERHSLRASILPSETAEGRLSRLRPRELEVMLLLAAGLQTREVAEALFITPQTVKTHVKQALKRSLAHSREELFGLLGSAHATETVRLATRRMQPFLDQWWFQGAQRTGTPIRISEALSSL